MTSEPLAAVSQRHQTTVRLTSRQRDILAQLAQDADRSQSWIVGNLLERAAHSGVLHTSPDLTGALHPKHIGPLINPAIAEALTAPVPDDVPSGKPTYTPREIATLTHKHKWATGGSGLTICSDCGARK
jgi:hypothetical protein